VGPPIKQKEKTMIVAKFREIMAELAESEEDAAKAESGNITAGRRLRKTSMNVIKALKELRTAVLEESRK
jgi:hypothetical protein